ncbi:GntR family transcriptional regulator [Aureimonas psammosilenae]|uniref:GntR family transcriptional regulator n=1 Tax=Aureimonas psammosilenae TaxID=2495496 RepID=UPI00186A8D6B|nr:UTRA domain-containing protein [Aureimonas psammosilenae]
MDSEYDNSTPLYDQVRLRLLGDLQSGRYEPGSYLPAEPELCRIYGVSRITLRRSVAELCAEGVLKKVHGRGTLVSTPKLNQALVSLGGFTETLQEQGISNRYLVVDVRESSLAGDLRARLASGGNEIAVSIRRILLADERPLTLETLVFLKPRYGGVVASVEKGGSFHAALQHVYGIGPRSAERVLNVDFPSAEEAALLKTSSLQPVFRIEKTVFDAKGGPIAFSLLVTPTDRVTYTLRI